MRSWAGSLFFVAALFALSCGAQAEKRVALVIGNSAYQNTAALKNPRSDADSVVQWAARKTTTEDVASAPGRLTEPLSMQGVG